MSLCSEVVHLNQIIILQLLLAISWSATFYQIGKVHIQPSIYILYYFFIDFFFRFHQTAWVNRPNSERETVVSKCIGGGITNNSTFQDLGSMTWGHSGQLLVSDILSCSVRCVYAVDCLPYCILRVFICFYTRSKKVFSTIQIRKIQLIINEHSCTKWNITLK